MKMLSLVAVGGSLSRSLRLGTLRRHAHVEQQQKPRRPKKIRQHLNPLAEFASRPVELDDGWYEKAFEDPSKPLTIDIGSGLGGWIKAASEMDQSRNYLGLEIRPAAVEVSKERLGSSGKNACFIKANANVDLKRITAEVPAPIEQILVQFPDPHFKKKHRKRRVVTPDLASVISGALAKDGIVYCASDVLDVAENMREIFDEEASLVRGDVDDRGWTLESPLPCPTERETCVLQGLGQTSTEPGTVFRVVFHKK